MANGADLRKEVSSADCQHNLPYERGEWGGGMGSLATLLGGNGVENAGGNARQMSIGKAQIGKQIKSQTVQLEKSKDKHK